MNLDDYIKSVPEEMQSYVRFSCKAENEADLAQKIEVMAQAMRAVFQELETIKRLLSQQGVLAESIYRETRVQVMLNDHCGRGCDPWTIHSDFPYLLSEEQYLRFRFEMSEAEIAQFKKDAKSLASMT